MTINDPRARNPMPESKGEYSPLDKNAPTPRTDSEAFDVHGLHAGTCPDRHKVVDADFARQLERELRALAAEYADLKVYGRAPVSAERPLMADEDVMLSLSRAKDQAYLERNYVVAALARAFPSGTRKTAIDGWSEDWHGCVYIDLPSGQVSYHYHDSQAFLFEGLPSYTKPWDGHDKNTVHYRLLAVQSSEQDSDEERLCARCRGAVVYAPVSSTGAPVAWRFRERLLGAHGRPTPTWGSWRHVGSEPQGPASDILQIEPLYSAPSHERSSDGDTPRTDAILRDYGSGKDSLAYSHSRLEKLALKLEGAAPVDSGALLERTAQIAAHRACCGTEHDPANGKLHGCCVVCGVPWPCEYAGTPIAASAKLTTTKEKS
jgi:hypothetical protein